MMITGVDVIESDGAVLPNATMVFVGLGILVAMVIVAIVVVDVVVVVKVLAARLVDEVCLGVATEFCRLTKREDALRLVEVTAGIVVLPLQLDILCIIYTSDPS